MKISIAARAAFALMMCLGATSLMPAAANQTPPTSPATSSSAAVSTSEASAPSSATATPGSDTSSGQRVVIAKGHVDVGPKIINGTWQAALRDDTVSPPVWRPLSDVVLKVVDAGKAEVPAGEDYTFLNLPAGSKPWVIPQTQNPDVVWLGWNTQDPEAANTMGRGTNLVLNGMTGPAPVNVFLQDGGFGPPRILWQTEKGPGQPIWMEVNSHVHMNWVFSQPGAYRFDVSMVAEAGDPAPSAKGALNIIVGDSTQPVDAVKDTTSSTATSATASDSAIPSDDVTSSQAAVQAPGAQNSARTAGQEESTSWVTIAAGSGLAAVAAAIAFVVWRQRRDKAASERAFEGQS